MQLLRSFNYRSVAIGGPHLFDMLALTGEEEVVNRLREGVESPIAITTKVPSTQRFTQLFHFFIRNQFL